MSYSKTDQLKQKGKPKKKKAQTRKSLIKELDGLVTKIVQLRDGRCITCGSLHVYCGHYHSRTHYATRWDLRNCHAQCNPCNARHEQDPYPYTREMIRLYGVEELDKLYQKHRQVTKYKQSDLLLIKEALLAQLDLLKA